MTHHTSPGSTSYVVIKKSRHYRGGPGRGTGRIQIFETLQEARRVRDQLGAENPVGYDIYVFVPVAKWLQGRDDKPLE